MRPSLDLLCWETRRLFRTGTATVALGLLAFGGLVALWSADREIARHREEIARLPDFYAAQMQRLAGQFADGGHAGYVAYYAFFPTWDPPPALAGLSVGLRDLLPAAVWVRLLGLEAQLYESGLGNPGLQSLGPFDLAFVVCALAPLVLLLLTHDLLTRDRERGVLPLAHVQSGGLGRLFAARLLVRAGAVAAVCTGLFVIAVSWHRIPMDGAALAWLGDALLHLLVWTAFAAVVAAACGSTGASLAAAGTVWLGAVVVLPAALNLGLTAAFPVPEGLELTVRQRQETHAGWDRPKEETFARFFAAYPEWRDTPPVTGRFAWKWYYALQHGGDAAVAASARTYAANLRARAAAAERLAWLVPPVGAQLLLSRRAGTDLEAHLEFLERVRAFHEALKHYFHPLIFAEAELKPAAWSAFPRYQPPAPAGSAGSWLERLPLAAAALGPSLAALVLVRRTSALPS
ncbi:MAG: DUF3526 domain-containing protein [Opitutaceae bacterium]|nr:DUF3526 domain-containing protein [Opitutaceae bacterium]